MQPSSFNEHSTFQLPSFDEPSTFQSTAQTISANQEDHSMMEEDSEMTFDQPSSVNQFSDSLHQENSAFSQNLEGFSSMA